MVLGGWSEDRRGVLDRLLDLDGVDLGAFRGLDLDVLLVVDLRLLVDAVVVEPVAEFEVVDPLRPLMQVSHRLIPRNLTQSRLLLVQHPGYSCLLLSYIND
jgi:hypothetical protein